MAKGAAMETTAPARQARVAHSEDAALDGSGGSKATLAAGMLRSYDEHVLPEPRD